MHTNQSEAFTMLKQILKKTESQFLAMMTITIKQQTIKMSNYVSNQIANSLI